MIRTLKKLKFPGGWDITKEPIYTFNAFYVTQNNRTSLLRTIVSNAIRRVFYDCSVIRSSSGSLALLLRRAIRLVVHNTAHTRYMGI